MNNNKKDEISLIVNKIRQNEQEFFDGGPSKANIIPTILFKLDLSENKESPAPVILGAVHSLRRIFTHLFHSKQIDKKGLDLKRIASESHKNQRDVDDSKESSDGSAAEKYTAWLQQQYLYFVMALSALMGDEKQGISIQAPSLRTLFELCKCEAASAETPCGLAHNRAFHVTLKSVLQGGTKIGEVFLEEYARPYADVRYYTLWGLKRMAEEMKDGTSPMDEDKIGEIMQLLMQIRIPSGESTDEFGEWLVPPPDINPVREDANSSDSDEDEEEPIADATISGSKKRKASQMQGARSGSRKKKSLVQTLAAHRKIFGKATISCLKLPMTPASYRQVLLWLPKHCIPHLVDPLQLADFLVDSYRQGGAISLLALESLFLLMTKYRLEYPEFYASLYELLTPTTCYTKYRQRYFELTNLALSSIKLPASTLAAFLKRACGGALFSPPTGGLYSLALTMHQLQRHSDLHSLIHRPPGKKQKTKVEERSQAQTQFNAKEQNPEMANALGSSLWELTALKDHYYPAVSSMAKGFQNKIDTKSLKLDVEDFTGLTYTALFAQEANRKKKETPVTFTNSRKVFDETKLVGRLFSTS